VHNWRKTLLAGVEGLGSSSSGSSSSSYSVQPQSQQQQQQQQQRKEERRDEKMDIDALFAEAERLEKELLGPL